MDGVHTVLYIIKNAYHIVSLHFSIMLQFLFGFEARLQILYMWMDVFTGRPLLPYMPAPNREKMACRPPEMRFSMVGLTDDRSL